MNSNLNAAILAADRADALMFAIESIYLDPDQLLEKPELANRAVHTLYAAWDAIKDVQKHLEKLDGDRRVVDVIRAVKDARKGGE